MLLQGGGADEQAMTRSVPALRVASFDDYQQINSLQSRHFSSVVTEAEWRGFFLNNPLWSRVKENWQIGWVLEHEGAVVGSITNIPSLYRWRGSDLLCANGRAWVVDAEYRGYALMLMDEYYSQTGVDLFVNNTVADWVTDVQVMFAHKVPLGDWAETAFRPTRYRGFASQGLSTRGIPLRRFLAPPVAALLWLKDSLFARPCASPPNVEVAEAAVFDARFDELWGEIAGSNPEMLLAERDSRTLEWHYAVPAARGGLRIFTASRAGSLRAYCVLVEHLTDDQFRSASLVDFQTAEPEVDLLTPLVRAASDFCAAAGIDAIQHLGCGIPKMCSFDRVAPYRIRSNWRFFYQSPKPELANDLSSREVWDPSEFDGDASLA